jgi:hypothetical protein
MKCVPPANIPTRDKDMFKKPVVENPAALAELVAGLGGTVIPADTLIFDLPVEKVQEAVPELNRLNLGVKKLGEYTREHPTRLFSDQSVARLQLVRQREAKGEDGLREGVLQYLFKR